MISVCIPVYNFYVVKLVNELHQQIQRLDIPSEIILIDDDSEKIFKDQNCTLSDKVRYIELKKNIGRAAIRNLFLTHSGYQYLLFLDCDSLIIRDNFLFSYINTIHENPDSVICGGREYEQKPPNQSKMLRWKYGIEKESKAPEVRRENPYRSFMTNNFVTERKILESIKFDEKLVDYGHEDTLFGFNLKKRSIPIIHIDNPILNGHLEDNSTYLQNTEKAIANLAVILESTSYNKEVIEDISLTKAYTELYAFRGFINLAFGLMKPWIKNRLSKGKVNLKLFDFYKLGTLSKSVKLQEK